MTDKKTFKGSITFFCQDSEKGKQLAMNYQGISDMIRDDIVNIDDVNKVLEKFKNKPGLLKTALKFI